MVRAGTVSRPPNPEVRPPQRADERDEYPLSLAGHRGSRPVRIGNGAAGQTQLDVYGELLEGAARFAAFEGHLDRDHGRRLGEIADFVCRIWERPDAGIWEVRREPTHFTQSKMMCAAALGRACELAERELIPAKAHQPLAARASAHPRLRRDARGPLVHRYVEGDGLPGEEGAFLTCSFWLAEAYARQGRLEEAAALLDELIGLPTTSASMPRKSSRTLASFSATSRRS